MVTEKARMLPVSWLKKSCAWSCQVPLAASPSKADRAELGVKLPVNGAFAVATDWMLGPALSSSRAVWQKLLPEPSVLLITRTGRAERGATG